MQGTSYGHKTGINFTIVMHATVPSPSHTHTVKMVLGVIDM